MTSRATPAVVPALATEPTSALFRQAALLAAPVMVEHLLHLAVGLTDAYMANHLPADAAAAGAAVGTISYFLWFIGLIVTAVGTGATAIIARAKGARHRSLANSVCGQSVTAATAMGLILSIIIFVFDDTLIAATGLTGKAPEYARDYLRMLCWSIPFSTLMFVANSCLRGAGDTLTPMLSMLVVDVINIGLTYGLTRGAWGLPMLGFDGIALGTVIAYIAGGVIQFFVLLSGRGGLRLYLHRLRPHWHTMKRVLRIGLPSGLEGLLVWCAQFAVVHVINSIDATNRVPTAHNNAVRIEGLSYMLGFAAAMAAATMVGQSLGMKDARRAKLSAYICYGIGGGIMTLWGLAFILFGGAFARWMSNDPEIARLTARCLFYTGFIQAGFAAAIVFSGALRGAGDTLAVMIINLASTVFIRFAGVLVVGWYLRLGLGAIWIVLCIELFARGLFVYLRFLHGGWKHAKV